MNDLISALILAVVQGLTEWLPVSSSGHLVLASEILGFDNSVLLDVSLHFGTLMAVFVYFGKDVVDMVEAVFKGRWKSEEARMALLLVIATIPAALIGYFFRRIIEGTFQSLIIVAFGFAITSMILFIASFDVKKKKDKISYADSFLIGCAQAVAILPGISRSGSTIASGLLLGLDEKKALKFSFLMSIPIIFGANLLEVGNNKLPTSLLLPTLVSFVVGMITIHFLLKVILTSKKNLRWFGLYALLLALGIGVYLAL